jgi:SAM-dependent methyltransferase
VQSLHKALKINKIQAKYYDSICKEELFAKGKGYAKNRNANIVTRFWASLRYKQQNAINKAGLNKLILKKHKKWANFKKGGRVLEIGCFSGSRLTYHLAKISKKYIGLELSACAVDILNKSLISKGYANKAKAINSDFLLYKSKFKYDLIYAHGALHHFRNSDLLFKKISDLSKPGTFLIFSEPSELNIVLKIVRLFYRPFQSDSAWEWPFTMRTVKNLKKYFIHKDGFGWGSKSIFLSIFLGLPIIGNLIKPIYINQLKKELGTTWSDRVWQNSYVTAIFEYKKNNKNG